jgi:hypothetical protein
MKKQIIQGGKKCWNPELIKGLTANWRRFWQRSTKQLGPLQPGRQY